MIDTFKIFRPEKRNIIKRSRNGDFHKIIRFSILDDKQAQRRECASLTPLCEPGDFDALRQRYDSPLHLSAALRKQLDNC
jgi:hypothetical protein